MFDNRLVHSSTSRQASFEFSWSISNAHVYKIVARPTSGQGRQFDLQVDGQSYFDMPKVFQLGLPNPRKARGAVPADNEVVQSKQGYYYGGGGGGGGQQQMTVVSSPPQYGGSWREDASIIKHPKTASEEEAELQAAIKESLAESGAQLNRQKSRSYEWDGAAAGQDTGQGHQRKRSNSDGNAVDLLNMAGGGDDGRVRRPSGGNDAEFGADYVPNALTTWDPFGSNSQTTPQQPRSPFDNPPAPAPTPNVTPVNGKVGAAGGNSVPNFSPRNLEVMNLSPMPAGGYASGGGRPPPPSNAAPSPPSASGGGAPPPQSMGALYDGNNESDVMDPQLKGMVNLDNLNNQASSNHNPFDSTSSNGQSSGAHSSGGGVNPSLRELSATTPKKSTTRPTGVMSTPQPGRSFDLVDQYQGGISQTGSTFSAGSGQGGNWQQHQQQVGGGGVMMQGGMVMQPGMQPGGGGVMHAGGVMGVPQQVNHHGGGGYVNQSYNNGVGGGGFMQNQQQNQQWMGMQNSSQQTVPMQRGGSFNVPVNSPVGKRLEKFGQQKGGL